MNEEKILLSWDRAPLELLAVLQHVKLVCLRVELLLLCPFLRLCLIREALVTLLCHDVREEELVLAVRADNAQQALCAGVDLCHKSMDFEALFKDCC